MFAKPVMPTAYCREDATWLQERLSELPPGQRGKIALAYAVAYQEAFDCEPVSYRQENAGRRAANKRLRVYAQTYSRANQGYTQPPPLAK